MLPNLRRTPHGYTYLKTVPEDLQPVIGKTVIKKALGRDFKLVKVLWAQLEAENTRLFHDARQRLAQGRSFKDALEAFEKSGPRNRQLKALPAGRKGLAEQLSALYLDGLSYDYSARKSGERWFDATEPDALTLDLEAVLDKIKTAVATGDVSPFKPAVVQLAEWRGYRLVDETGDDVQALTYEFLRAAKMACEVLVARQRGEFAEPASPGTVLPLPAAWELDIPPSPGRPLMQTRLSDVTPLYTERLSIADSKTRSTSLSRWQRFIDFCRDKPLSKVTPTDVYEFLESRLHANEQPWSMAYCSVAKRGLTEAFALAKTKGLCTHNPANELDAMPKISASEEKKRKKPRHAYSVSQLNILFASQWYDPEAPNWRQRVKWDLGARYWVPLLCLFHGFRIREALQLHVHDVELDAHPLLSIQVEADGETASLPTRRLKNEATKRTVPVHPVLVQLGFCEFVSNAQKFGARSPLFPSALPEKGGKSPMWGRAYEQRFVPFVRDVLAFGPGYGNHSFRHTLEDCLRDIQLDEVWPAGLPQFYTGRTLPSDKDKEFFRQLGSERFYGEGFDANRILRYVGKIRYDRLKLPQPFEAWLGGRPTADSRLVALLDREWGDAWRQQ
ncbi:TPA: hypothetical protein QDA94_005332 [Burkholderia vietnamiensis]|uniref:Phage integrase family protein n=1 Tax=Burkholderia vietnamiensis TaxID=60552 RepID=A0AAW7T1N4_BURVI|nr:hypothetical protein [Burkholderia vietnamiensis]MDN7795474.1 hypothetical protein [Burkholderia vietnamiensis]HDR8920156.1 hypothetical protein [Burkholderia vietnamiensis]HDR8940689.1 hypothetical protein [Burkholderia vietnamiensis]HDR8977928.1 hypothetical protein [Burkholderia vietnamiensis]HDR9051052.1 hypothetical protein [Burkholderia vietnamiensis]